MTQPRRLDPDEVSRKIEKSPAFNNGLSEDEKVVKMFVDNIQFKLDHGFLKAPYGKERKALEDKILYPGAVVGAFAGVTTFFALRKGPIYVMNRILSKQKNDAISRVDNMRKGASRLDKDNNFKEPMAAKVFGSLLDSTLGVLTGLTVWVLSVDKKGTLQTCADLPLLEGRSEISDKLCDDFIDIYRNETRPQFWRDYSDDTLSALKVFSENCEKRRLFERRLRRDYGLRIDEDVELPSRVPEDIVREERDRFGGADWADDFDDQDQDTF